MKLFLIQLLRNSMWFNELRSILRARGVCPSKPWRIRKQSGAKSNSYARTANVKPGFTIIESVLTLIIIGTALTAIFSLQTKLIRSVFGTHDIIDHVIGVRNFTVQDDQEEYYKQGKAIDKKIEDKDYSISYEPKSAKQFPALSSYKNIVVEKIKLSSKSVLINSDEFVFFRFSPEGKK